MLRYWTAGESHGKALAALIDQCPAGFDIDVACINAELRRRQMGYGRGKRQSLESDEVDIVSGIWNGKSIGSPIQLIIRNNDDKLPRLQELARPRPGHGDLTGAIKYLGSIRGTLERASARETAARVAAGALAAQFTRPFGIVCFGYVVEIGGIPIPPLANLTPEQRLAERAKSELFTLDSSRDKELKKVIDDARADGDTLGGIIEVVVEGVPMGVGNHAQWNQKLDGRLAQAIMSIQAIKGVEIGLGFEMARRRGSQVHDPIQYDPAQKEGPHMGYIRPTNNAGGIEAGIANGQPIVLRAAKKPISTLQNPIESIDMETKLPHRASYERSDICAVPAASVIAENVVAFEVAAAFLEKFGGDSYQEIQDRHARFLDMARKR